MTSSDISLPSYVTFGGYDTSSYESPNYIIAHPVSGSFHWQLNLVSYSYDGNKVTPTISKVLIDTGTTLIILTPSNLIPVYY